MLDKDFSQVGNSAGLKTGNGDKKSWMSPLALPFLAIGGAWMRAASGRQTEADAAEYREKPKDRFSPPALFRRSLIFIFEKA